MLKKYCVSSHSPSSCATSISIISAWRLHDKLHRRENKSTWRLHSIVFIGTFVTFQFEAFQASLQRCPLYKNFQSVQGCTKVYKCVQSRLINQLAVDLPVIIARSLCIFLLPKYTYWRSPKSNFTSNTLLCNKLPIRIRHSIPNARALASMCAPVRDSFCVGIFMPQSSRFVFVSTRSL